MKAPDKIYIPIIEEDGKKLLCTNWWETDARSRYVNETIPYIRKDALLEWLQERKKYYQSLIPADGAVAFICALDEVKYKINNL